jgi:Protein of unknown function (DUF3467)
VQIVADEQAKGREKESGTASGAATVPTVNWDDSSMKTSYANVVNAASTREEVTLFFGTNLTWNPGQAKEFHVRLSDRVVLNPFAAKRLWILLGAILKEYETRFGALNMDLTSMEGQQGRGASSSRIDQN